MNLIKILFSVCFFAGVWTNVYSHQGSVIAFKGKLKKDSVFVEVTGHEGFWTMSWFDVKNLKENYLSGRYDSSMESFIFSSEKDSVIIFKQKKDWQAIWWQGKKKTKMQLDSLYAKKNDISIYQQNRLDRLTFEQVSGNDSTLWVREIHSGILFFRLKKTHAEAMNQKLLSIHQSMALKAMNCEMQDKTVELATQMYHLGEEYLSFMIQEKGSCDQETNYFNFQHKEGKILRLEDLFYFGAGEAPRYQSADWFTYRYKVFPKKLIPFLKVEDTCLNDAELWQFPTWYISRDTLVFKPFTAFGKENCKLDTERLVPLSEILSDK